MKSNHKILKEYYQSECRKLVFLEERTINPYSYIHMYIYEYKKELENFKDLFTKYFPYYVDNYSTIEVYKLDYDIAKELERQSKKEWYSSHFDERPIEKWGIFGELFMDFYVRIVTKNEVMLTYAAKKGYKDKNEFKGIDGLACSLNGEQLEIIFSEAKFVDNIANAKRALIEDIIGQYDKKGNLTKVGHLNQKEINNYFNFALKKQDAVSEVLKKKAVEKIQIINKKMMEDKEFIDIINEMGYKIRFVYFAIYKSNRKRPEEIFRYYSEIVDAFNKEITNTKIKNFNIDIVFIPTDNDSNVLKNKMVEMYHE